MASSSFTSDLLTGLAMDLADQGIGVWNPDGAYETGQTGIVLNYFPDQPSDIITLSPYGVQASTDGDDIQGVQVRTRRDGQDPRPTFSLADDVFEAWHMRQQFDLPEIDPDRPRIHVTQIGWRSSVSGGRDASGRSSLIQNFYVQHPRILVNRP